jgi:hypothetical protein
MVRHATKFIIETAITKARDEAFKWRRAWDKRDPATTKANQDLD